MRYLIFKFFKASCEKGALIKQKAKPLDLSCCISSVLTVLLGYHKQASWRSPVDCFNAYNTSEVVRFVSLAHLKSSKEINKS